MRMFFAIVLTTLVGVTSQAGNGPIARVSGPVAYVSGPIANDVDCNCKSPDCECETGGPCVGVSCNGGWASGTAIVGAPKGKTWIVTAKHVAEKDGRFVRHNTKTYTATTIATHPTADVAIIQIDGNLPAAKLASPKPGMSVTLQGYGGSWSGPVPGAFDTPRVGRVTYNSSSTMGTFIQHGPGDSGAGYLVGVLSGGYRGTRNSVGVPASVVQEILPKNDNPPEPDAQLETITDNDGNVKQVWAVRNPSASQPDCVGGVCRINGASNVSSGGTCVGGNCPSTGNMVGGTMSGASGVFFSQSTTTVTRSGREPILRIRGGKGMFGRLRGGCSTGSCGN